MAKSTDRKSSLSRKRAEAGRQGARAVQAAFGAVLTRRRVAELVGVSLSTIRRWERAGVITSRQVEVLNIPTTVFEPADVEFGRRLIGVLRRANGEVTLEQAATIVHEGRRH